MNLGKDTRDSGLKLSEHVSHLQPSVTFRLEALAVGTSTLSGGGGVVTHLSFSNGL